MEDLDRKFIFTATKTKDGVTVTQKEAIIFLAKDNLLIPTLTYYKELCIRSGASDEQVVGVDLLINRVLTWRNCNQDKLKYPDIGDEEAEYVCKPNKPKENK